MRIDPIVVVGSKEETFGGRNEPIRIDVKVNQNVQALAEVAEGAARLETTVPSRMTADSEVEVSARLPLLGYGDSVDVTIDLKQGDGSVAAVIRRVRQETVDGALVQTWTVLPEGPGVLELVFASTLSTQAGKDTRVDKVVEVDESVRTVASAGSRFFGWVGSLGALLGVVLAGLTIWGMIRKRRRSNEGDQGGQDPPAPPAEETSGAPAG